MRAAVYSFRRERARSVLIAHVGWLSGPKASGWGIGSARPDTALVIACGGGTALLDDAGGGAPDR
jgi:hypothetical protein